MNRIFYGQEVAAKTRIDQLLVTRGLPPSLWHTGRAIMAGRVTVGGRMAQKPGLQVLEAPI